MTNKIMTLNQNQINAVFGGTEDGDANTVTPPDNYVDLPPGGIAWKTFEGIVIVAFTLIAIRKFAHGKPKQN
ncbi:MAG: hypothetical protein WCH10_05050 [bacterium]